MRSCIENEEVHPPGRMLPFTCSPTLVFLYFYTSAPSYESPLLEIIDTEHLSRRHLLIVQLQHNLLVCYTTELLSHHSVCDTNCQQQEAQTIASIQFGLIQRQENTHTPTHKFFLKKSVYSVYGEAIEYQVLFSLAVQESIDVIMNAHHMALCALENHSVTQLHTTLFFIYSDRTSGEYNSTDPSCSRRLSARLLSAFLGSSN